MSDLRDLYQEVILDHGKRPRNYRKPEGPSLSADGYNPLCGDKVTVYLILEGDVVRDVAFQGKGCAISTASASMMTEALKGKTRTDVEELFKRFHGMITGDAEHAAAVAPELGKLGVFAGVCEYPARVKCATLAWHTLHAALEQRRQPVSTE
jgi:nitrogen fixation protein NifU and related proteins